jgi:hypothetical protein
MNVESNKGILVAKERKLIFWMIVTFGFLYKCTFHGIYSVFFFLLKGIYSVLYLYSLRDDSDAYDFLAAKFRLSF